MDRIEAALWALVAVEAVRLGQALVAMCLGYQAERRAAAFRDRANADQQRALQLQSELGRSFKRIVDAEAPNEPWRDQDSEGSGDPG